MTFERNQILTFSKKQWFRFIEIFENYQTSFFDPWSLLSPYTNEEIYQMIPYTNISIFRYAKLVYHRGAIGREGGRSHHDSWRSRLQERNLSQIICGNWNGNNQQSKSEKISNPSGMEKTRESIDRANHPLLPIVPDTMLRRLGKKLHPFCTMWIVYILVPSPLYEITVCTKIKTVVLQAMLGSSKGKAKGTKDWTLGSTWNIDENMLFSASSLYVI